MVTDNRPEAAAQRALDAAIRDSPFAIAQCRELSATFGNAPVQRMIDKAALNLAVNAAGTRVAKVAAIDGFVNPAYSRLQARVPADEFAEVEQFRNEYRDAPSSTNAEYKDKKAPAAKSFIEALIALDQKIEKETPDSGIGDADFATQGSAAIYINKLATRHQATVELVRNFAPARLNDLTNAWTAVQNALNAGVYAPAITEAAVKRYLELMRTEEFAADPERTMLVGTEFTFTSEAIQGIDIKKGGAPVKRAAEIIKEFASHVASSKIFIEQQLNPPGVTWEALNFAAVRAENKSPDESGMKAAKFTYVLPSGAGWWWKADIDYGCIETQAQPFTKKSASGAGGQDAQAIRAIIDQHIFGAARASGVSSHAEIGGGHLSLDRATTFGDNARWLRNFLVLYANDPERWKKEDIDWFNAPMITELKGSGKAEFKKAITEFDRNPATTTVEALIGTLRTKVFTLKNLPDPQTEDQTAANKERQNQPVHYQATNLEHVDDEDPAKRRLEMRRFDAQRDLDDLVNNMVALSELVRECRLPGLVPVKF